MINIDFPKPREREETLVKLNHKKMIILDKDMIVPFIVLHALWNTTSLSKENFLATLEKFIDYKFSDNKALYYYYEDCFNSYIGRNNGKVFIEPPFTTVQIATVNAKGWSYGLVMPLNNGIEGIGAIVEKSGFSFFEFMKHLGSSNRELLTV